jgi:hypothetical protein
VGYGFLVRWLRIFNDRFVPSTGTSRFQEIRMTTTLRTVALGGLLLLTACSDMSTTQQRVLSGAAIGTGVGAVGTVMTGGCVACGAAIGGAVGAASGYVYDQVEKSK